MSLFILDDMIVDESSDPHENKRVKITTACDTCRRRKVKCDGSSPCANCQRGGYQCTFSDASTKRPRGPPKGFVALIEDRLHTIESLLVNLVNKDTNDIKEIKQETETPIDETSERRNISTIKFRQYSPSNAITSANNNNNNNNPTQHLSIPTTPPADANSLSDVQYQPFVSSFGDDLTSDDEDAIQHNLASCTSSNFQNSALFLLHRPGSYIDPPLPISLPQSNPLPQDVANQLLEKYFTHFHPFFPIINRSQLLGQLSNPEDQPSPLLLNAIYAVGALYPPILQDSYSPLTFYERARNLLDFFVDAPRLSTVQALILLCMVDQGKTSSYRPQTYSFMAIRMAQSMGLNRKYGAAYRQSKDLHTKKLVWWACFIIDRLHSLTTDDPLTINEKTCDIGLPSLDEIDDQQEPGQNLYNPSHTQRIAVFLHFIRLTQVMGHIIGHLQSTACTGILYHNMISYYETALTRWSSELPSYLQLPPTTGHSTPFSGQIAAIQMHYQNLRIMLYYPYLLAQARNSRSSKTYLKSRDVCTTAANTITKIGVASLNNVYVCITFPTMFHCLAHAAKVHVFNITSAERGLAISAHNNVFKTIEIFKFYVEHGVMAELANQTIKALENVLATHREKFAVINNRVSEMTSQSSTATSTPTLTSQIYSHPLGNDSVGPSTPNGIISMTHTYPPYSSPTSTHSGSPINPGSPKVRQTQNFTYVQPEEAESQSFIPVNNGMSAAQYSPDQFYEPIPTAVNTNMMSTNFPGMAPEGPPFLGLEMGSTQPNMVDFSGYEITSSPVNIGSVLTSSKHFQQLRHHASTPLSTSSSLSSSSSSSSMSFKSHRQSNHPSLDSIDDDLESEGALIRSVLANNVR